MRSKKPKPEQQTLFPPAEVEYSNPGTIRAMSTSQLTSDLPYQRGVAEVIPQKLSAVFLETKSHTGT